MSNSLWSPGLVAFLASLFSTVSRSLLKLMSIESVMLSNPLIFCCPLLLCLQSFPTLKSFLMSQLFSSGGQITEASASASVLPMNIQGWFSFRIDWLDLLAVQGTLKIFSSTTVQKHQFFCAQSDVQLISVHDYWKNHSFGYDYIDLCWQSNVSSF